VQTLPPLLSDGASIILSASASADRGGIGTSLYAATKAAVRSFARTWANELAPRNMWVNAVNPAFTDTVALAGLAGATTAEAFQRLKITSVKELRFGAWRRPTRWRMRRCFWHPR